MSEVITPQKTDLGWVMEVPLEMAQALKVAPGSIAILYPKEGVLETEILPAPTDELRADFERLYQKYEATFKELKRLGD
jgi:hypothetical protein